MDSATLKADIDTLAGVLNSLAGLLPNSRIGVYVTTIQSIVENPVVLAILVAWINATVTPTLPVTQAPPRA